MDIKDKIKRAIEAKGADMEKLGDLFSMVCHCEDTEKRREWLLYVRSEARKLLTADAYELLRKTYVLGAKDGSFDDYCIALEWYRAPEKRFYLPRRAVLKPLVDDLQDLFDGELDFLGVSLPPRVGKSTPCIFFMTFVMGHRPAAASVMSGHSDKLTDGFYRELLSIITDDTQYRWHDVSPADELRHYNGVLPDGEPDRIAAVVDTAWGGGDSLSMPVAYVYGEEVYIHDVVFNSGDKTVTRPLVIGTLKKHRPHTVRWESNNGGDEYGGIVDERLRADGIRVNMSYKKAPTNQSKLSRIIQFAPDIKKFYFIDGKHRSAEYEKFMRELTLFTVSGKNLHDDAPDACAMLVDFLVGWIKTVTVARRPF